jgi:hypothetical protein
MTSLQREMSLVSIKVRLVWLCFVK